MILLPGDPLIHDGELRVLMDYGISPLPFVVDRADKSPVCLQVQLRDEENHFIGRGDVFSVIPATSQRALSVTYSPVEGYPVKLPKDEGKILDPSTLPPWALAPYLGNVYIIEEYRGKGFGLQLFQEMVKVAKDLVFPRVNYCLGITAKKRVMEIAKKLGGWLIDPSKDNFLLFCFPDRVKEPDDWLVGDQLNFLSVDNGPYTLPYLIIAGFSSD